jgi:hypothetical protein
MTVLELYEGVWNKSLVSMLTSSLSHLQRWYAQRADKERNVVSKCEKIQIKTKVMDNKQPNTSIKEKQAAT